MYSPALTGKNLSEAKEILREMGIAQIEVVHNDTRGEYKSDCTLVVKADICDNRAKLYTSKFLLEVENG